MEVFPALRAFLLADTAIAALVGTRVYPVIVPQGAPYPAITIRKISGIRYGHLRGPASLVRPRYQIDAIADGGTAAAYRQSQALGTLIRQRLEAFDGVMVDATVSPVVSWRVWVQFDDERDLFDPEDVSGGFSRHSADYFVFYNVPAT
jgi:hypothetical protein